MRMQAIRWLLLCLILAALSGLVSSPPSMAQGGTEWSDPMLLSDPYYSSQASTIAADPQGNVHVMWSQATAEDPLAANSDALFYTRWDGESWTSPIDVLVSPDGKGAGSPELATTPDGMVHAIWVTGGLIGSTLLYSHAPACCADKPQNWSPPVALDSSVLDTAALIADTTGRLHVAYAPRDRPSTVAYLRSDDGGATWPTQVDVSADSLSGDEYVISPRLAADERGRVHMVWSVQPAPGRYVMYARSDDGGDSWSTPQVIDSWANAAYRPEYGPTLIDVEAHGQDEVHLIWDGAPTVERNHSWSSDGGDTWSAPQVVFPEVTKLGRSGWNDMVFDSSGALHAVSLVGTGGALHSQWDGRVWSASKDISKSAQFPADAGPEFLQSALSLGNRLHVTWLSKSNRPFTVWYVEGITAAPAVAPQPLTVVRPTPSVTPAPIANAESTPTAAPTLPQGLNPTPLRSQASSAAAVLAGLVPALLLVAAVVIYRLRSRG